MNIIVTSGKGTGKTLLSAFDTALKDAGVYNYNLITLSSVIPPGTKIVKRKFHTPKDEYGHKLYVVMSDIRSQNVDYYIGASLGWYQLDDGRGVFVEHKTEANFLDIVKETLYKKVKDSLTDLCANRRFSFNEKKMDIATSITKVTTQPTCALIIAVYESEVWHIAKKPVISSQ
jgi:arginine decarboxylase